MGISLRRSAPVPEASTTQCTDAAFNEVLAAEARAREQVDRCRQAAADLRSAAGEAARSIADRTDRRMRRTHELADAALARGLRDLLGHGTGSGVPPIDPNKLPPPGEGDDPSSSSCLDQAIAALVDEILAAPADGQPP
jgi:hypothetical protein